jgi:hypothetical protein
VKRGLITWDKAELPPMVFDRRQEIARKVLAARHLPAMLVYSDLWRSNQARFFANYMPYFNRALLILPVEGKPTLLCGLSPRTYRWIQSVTPIEDVRPAGNFAKPLEDIAAERGWFRVGVLDAPQLPYDLSKTLHAGTLTLVNVESEAVFHPAKDDHEILMRRKAAEMARDVISDELSGGMGKTDHEFVGQLEKRLRLSGAEDLVILLTNGVGAPAPACGKELAETFSVSVALEYRGHWVRLSRSRLPNDRDSWSRATLPHFEGMAGSYPYEVDHAGEIRAFDGETLWQRESKGWEIL